MATVIRLNKPSNVLCQFTDDQGRETLADYVSVKGVYAAGRLDYDSEGLVLLTDNGALQHRIAAPENKLRKTYWVQVEGVVEQQALEQLAAGVKLKDGVTAPARCQRIEPAQLWPRVPPVRSRKSVPTSWLELSLTEGRNRQVRRMTAAVGHPTLRLIRVAIGPWKLDQLQPGEMAREEVHLPRPAGRQSERPGTKSAPGSGRKPPSRRRTPR